MNICSIVDFVVVWIGIQELNLIKKYILTKTKIFLPLKYELSSQKFNFV
jgi:hypothetical protein